MILIITITHNVYIIVNKNDQVFEQNVTEFQEATDRISFSFIYEYLFKIFNQILIHRALF